MEDGPEMYEGGAAQKLNKMHEENYRKYRDDNDPVLMKLDDTIKHYRHEWTIAKRNNNEERLKHYTRLLEDAKERREKRLKQLEHSDAMYSRTGYARKSNVKPSESEIEHRRDDKKHFIDNYGDPGQS